MSRLDSDIDLSHINNEVQNHFRRDREGNLFIIGKVPKSGISVALAEKAYLDDLDGIDVDTSKVRIAVGRPTEGEHFFMVLNVPAADTPKVVALLERRHKIKGIDDIPVRAGQGRYGGASASVSDNDFKVRGSARGAT